MHCTSITLQLCHNCTLIFFARFPSFSFSFCFYTFFSPAPSQCCCLPRFKSNTINSTNSKWCFQLCVQNFFNRVKCRSHSVTFSVATPLNQKCASYMKIYFITIYISKHNVTQFHSLNFFVRSGSTLVQQKKKESKWVFGLNWPRYHRNSAHSYHMQTQKNTNSHSVIKYIYTFLCVCWSMI